MGEHKEFYKNGSIKCICFLNDEGFINGLYTEYLNDGSIKEQHIYNNGILQNTLIENEYDYLDNDFNVFDLI